MAAPGIIGGPGNSPHPAPSNTSTSRQTGPNYAISGVTKDVNGSALGSCLVKLFNAATDTLEQSTTSDASGNYSFTVDPTKTWYILAYKAGAPDVAGTTVNTLSGA